MRGRSRHGGLKPGTQQFGTERVRIDLHLYCSIYKPLLCRHRQIPAHPRTLYPPLGQMSCTSRRKCTLRSSSFSGKAQTALVGCVEIGRLVEETEAHVVVGLLLLCTVVVSLGDRHRVTVSVHTLNLLLLLGSLGSSASSSATGSGSAASTTAGNGGELGGTLSDELQHGKVSK